MLNKKNRTVRWTSPALKLLIFVWACIGGNMSRAEGSMEAVPGVISAKVPFYPNILKVKNIHGVVHLRITTDGIKITQIDIVDGNPELAKVAIENVKTWEFRAHKPIVFISKFTYSIKVVPPCEPNEHNKDVVILSLPSTVEVHATWQGECDPVAEGKGNRKNN